MNKIINWLGQTMEFEGNLSSAIAEHRITNFPGSYIYEDDLFNISADPEIPIKGYMVIGICKEIVTIEDLTREERNRLMNLTNRLIKAMHISGFKKIIIYQDETSTGNLHINFIPRHEWTYKFYANFGEMGVYAKNYLNTSDNYRKEMLEIIEVIKRNFK